MGELIKGFHDPETVRTALLTIAINGGDCEKAHKALTEQGIANLPTSRTLRKWRSDQYPHLYRELHDTHGKQIEDAIVPLLRDNAIQGFETALLAISEARKQINNGQTKDPAGAARNLMVTAATAMDKTYLATDRPTSVTEHRDVAEILRSLEKHAAKHTTPAAIEGTAEEVS